MASTVTIDLRHVARGLEFPLRQVQAVVELLDEGNTVPFITRYRKDQSGGLDEQQIREIQARLTKMRQLADRKQTILRSIESQGKLSEKLTKQILGATTTKRLEDLYLPYKPKKQTLATLARSRGLEELAREILEAAPTCTDLDARARDFVNPDRQVPSGADALLGAGHILAELLSERADLRQRLREILQRTGKILTSRIGADAAPLGEVAKPQSPPPPVQAAATPSESSPTASPGCDAVPGVVQTPAGPSMSAPVSGGELPAESPLELPAAAEAGDAPRDAEAPLFTPLAEADPPAAPQASDDPPAAAQASDDPPAAAPATGAAPAAAAAPVSIPAARRLRKERAEDARQKRELKKRRLDERRIKAFRDYFNYSEEIRRIPPHRVLAINRGERARVLRVKIEVDLGTMHAVLEEMLVPAGHPHADYLRGCARDALARLILPALEREIRRELADRAESHAVVVFAKNLRNLLLQPPVHNRAVLAVDPGFKSGCKLVALDQFGNVLGHDAIFLVGKPGRRDEAKQKSLDLIRRFQLGVVAVGNGTACREAEEFFAELIEAELRPSGTAYVIVNEAGASVYSTSQIGREEFPDYDASLRGALSIGRRLLDPLSELVKIEPANIGVGLYQHDVKAKHLQASLDEVVESCVNYVGVDVNTASPALLRYVSGLNQLTARRVYEHRRQYGPFRNREMLRQVPGFGEATFVQAAGFLKINGDNPLDATWIHPESYAVATQVLAQLGCRPADLTEKEAAAALAQRVAAVDLEAMAQQLGVGVLTLRDILAQFARPGRDPREDLPPPVFKQGVLKLEDLTPGMELTGTVLNVVDFGCFVDIGMHDSGLVHVSRMADRFIRDPHEAVAVGDIVKVWVMEVDRQRRRVSLTMIRPGSERPRRQGPRSAASPAGGAVPDAAAGGEVARRHAAPGGRGTRDSGSGHGRRPPSGQQGPPGGRPGPSGPPPQHQRPKGPPYGRPRPEGRPQSRPPPPRPRPRVPISDAMKAGKEPMRTFSDLLQFYEAKEPQPPEERPAPPGGPDSSAIGVPKAQDDPAVATTPLAAEPPRSTSDGGPSASAEPPPAGQPQPPAAELPAAEPKPDELPPVEP
jgi:transcriptional accessory protein Tex/SPT6